MIGRRRRASYGIIKIKKGKKSSCTVSANLGNNLRLRDGDKIKVVSLGEHAEDQPRSGDMALLKGSPSAVASVTFSPVEDSLSSLEASEGGDEIGDDEITERFVTPYVNLEEDDSDALIKKGHVLTLHDDNNKALDFIVTHVELEGAAEDEEEGTCRHCFCRFAMMLHAQVVLTALFTFGNNYT